MGGDRHKRLCQLSLKLLQDPSCLLTNVADVFPRLPGELCPEAMDQAEK